MVNCIRDMRRSKNKIIKGEIQTGWLLTYRSKFDVYLTADDALHALLKTRSILEMFLNKI